MQIHSIAEKSTNLQHWTVTRIANPLFTGRDTMVHQIRETLMHGEPRPASQQRRFVIFGPAGIGKSEICLNLANLLQSSYVYPFDVGLSLRDMLDSGGFSGSMVGILRP
jgi:Mrp family chromosome partitioning ATPase